MCEGQWILILEWLCELCIHRVTSLQLLHTSLHLLALGTTYDKINED